MSKQMSPANCNKQGFMVPRPKLDSAIWGPGPIIVQLVFMGYTCSITIYIDTSSVIMLNTSYDHVVRLCFYVARVFSDYVYAYLCFQKNFQGIAIKVEKL